MFNKMTLTNFLGRVDLGQFFFGGGGSRQKVFTNSCPIWFDSTMTINLLYGSFTSANFSYSFSSTVSMVKSGKGDLDLENRKVHSDP